MTATYTFKPGKYTRWYYAIVAKKAIKDWRRKGEVHHIMPRSLGGGDERSNLVKLSGHDHAWCHWLLTKMTEGDAKSKMCYAFNMMGVYGDHMERGMSYAIVRAYEKNRIEWSKNHSDKMKSQFENGREAWNKGLDMKDDPRCKGGKKNKGRVMDPSSVAQRVVTMRANGNDKRSDETKALMSSWQAGVPKGPQSEEHRKAIANGVRGKPKAEGHGDNVAAAVMGNISINKDGKEKRVKEHQLQAFLDDGWALGGRPRKTKTVA